MDSASGAPATNASAGGASADAPPTQSWADAIKAADPMGFNQGRTTSAEEIALARERAAREFEASGAGSAFKSEVPERKKPSKELLANLCDEFGRMDPTKCRKFASELPDEDPWRVEIEAALAARAADEEALGLGGGKEQQEQREQMMRAQEKAQENRRAHYDKNAGEVEGGADGNTWRWEQTSNGGESEVLVRFRLPRPASKKEVNVGFKVQGLSVTVAGEQMFDGKLCGKIYPDECTWSLVEQLANESYSSEIVHELQVLLSLAEDEKWADLCAK